MRGWVGATADTIYPAIMSQFPDKGELRAQFDRDTLHVVSDDSIELYLNSTPDQADNVDYQMLVNSKGFGGYHLHTLGNPRQDVSWRGDWTQAHGFHDGWWHAEIAIPIKSMDTVKAGRRTTDGVWAVNLCRNWASHQWSSLSGGLASYAQSGVWFAFTDKPAPAGPGGGPGLIEAGGKGVVSDVEPSSAGACTAGDCRGYKATRHL